MKDIKELIENVDRYKKATIQKRFDSNKNTVAYILLDGKPRILKWYAPGFKRNMETEYDILNRGSSKLNLPIPIEKDMENNVIIMSYIIGENLCDVINDSKTTTNEKQGLIILLAEWFSRFHRYFKKRDKYQIRGDSILRNFIFTDRIWGVDFEESRIGNPIEDIASMCASILSTDPMFIDEKFDLCKIFIKSYAESVRWHLTNVNDEIAYALLERIQWRPKQEDILRRYSKKIREQGIY